MTTGAISAGAVAGALLRFWLQRWLNTSALTPLGTLLANLSGAFLLGLVLRLVSSTAHPNWFALLTAGFCGSFTTFSALTMELFEMARAQAWTRAALYTFGTFGLGLISFVSGYYLGTWLSGKA
ncbi:MAG: CrcB family protein [Bacteroidia bacterium]